MAWKDIFKLFLWVEKLVRVPLKYFISVFLCQGFTHLMKLVKMKISKFYLDVERGPRSSLVYAWLSNLVSFLICV